MNWISVKDSLPEDGERVDVWRGGIFKWRQCEVYFIDDGEEANFYRSSTMDDKLLEVTHWMREPEPPMQEES